MIVYGMPSHSVEHWCTDMKTCLPAVREFSWELPDEYRDEDVRLSERVLAYLLEKYSLTNQAVFDPFAGFGTTLLVAERLNRIGYGIERDRKRWACARSELTYPERMLLGDVKALDFAELPEFSLSISSPVYMNETDDLDPLSGFSDVGDYGTYIRSLISIYSLVGARTAAGGYLVVEVANLKSGGVTTTFAWDLARALASKFHFEGELVLDWGESGYGYGYSHSYCLIFRT